MGLCPDRKVYSRQVGEQWGCVQTVRCTVDRLVNNMCCVQTMVYSRQIGEQCGLCPDYGVQ